MKEHSIHPGRAVRRLLCSAAVLLILGLLALPQAHAQRGQRGPVDKEAFLHRSLSMLTEQIGLTDEQVEQVRPILAEQFDKRQALRQQMREQGRGDRQAAREQMIQLHDDTHRRIKALLSEEQIEKFRAFQQEQQRGRRGGRFGGGARS